jgi:hypothetical protein
MSSLLLLLAAAAMAADPTVVCDGRGDYRTEVYGRDGTLLGPCFQAHEVSHVRDLRESCPEGCRGQPDGAAHGTGDPRCPGWKKTETYLSWLKTTECAGYAAEAACLRSMARLVRVEAWGEPVAAIREAADTLATRSREVDGYRAAWGCEGPADKKTVSSSAD